MGRIGLTPNGLTLIGFAITTVGARPGRRAGVGHRRHRRLRRRRLRHVRRHAGPRDRQGQQVRRVHGLDLRQAAGEVLVFIGIVIGALANSNVGTVPSWWPPAAMGAAIMVSYTRAKSDGLGFLRHGHGRGRDHAPRGPPRDPLGSGIVLDAATSIGIVGVLAVRPRRSSLVGASHHRHPADPPCPQPGQVGRHHRSPRPPTRHGVTT